MQGLGCVLIPAELVYHPFFANPGARLYGTSTNGLKLENSIVGEATSTHPEQYTVQHGGRPRKQDWHLKRGDSRERTRCFRLYHFWDDETAVCRGRMAAVPPRQCNDLTVLP